MSLRISIVGALGAAVLTIAAPAVAFDTKEDDLRWVATGSQPAINYTGRYIAFEAAGADTTVLGWRDMNTRAPRKGRSSARYPTLGYDWTQVAWQGDSGQEDVFCGFGGVYYQIYGSAADLLPRPQPASLYSRQTLRIDGLPAGGAGNSKSEHPALSGDGTSIAFESLAGNFAPSIFAGCTPRQIFVRDFLAGTTHLVSIGIDGAAGDLPSRNPSISATGRYVAFESQASNLVPGDQVSSMDVFLRDVNTRTTAIVSHADGSGTPTGGSQAAVSGDGRYVAYTGTAPPGLFATGGAPLTKVVYVRDMQTDTSVIASRGNGPGGAPVEADRPSISADGRYVSFMTADATAVPDPVTLTVPNGIVRDLQTGENRLGTRAKGKFGAPLNAIDGNAGYPRLSGNGRYLVFWTQSDTISPLGKKGQSDIYLRDVWGPPPGADRVNPVISGVRLTNKNITLPASCEGAVAALSVLQLTCSEPGGLRVEFRQKSGKTVTVVAAFSVAVNQGKNTVPLTGCVGLDLLPKGSLTLTVEATDLARNASKTKILALKVQ